MDGRAPRANATRGCHRRGWLRRADDRLPRVVTSRGGVVLDQVVPRASRMADHLLVWWLIAAVPAAAGDRRSRRAAVRAVPAMAVAGPIANAARKSGGGSAAFAGGKRRIDRLAATGVDRHTAIDACDLQDPAGDGRGSGQPAHTAPPAHLVIHTQQGPQAAAVQEADIRQIQDHVIAWPARAESEGLQPAGGHHIQLTTYRDDDNAPKTVTGERKTSHNIERKPPR
jgi:hypothetical protein